jgi:hypothetical protein
MNFTQPYRSRQCSSPTWAADALSVPTNFFDYSGENLFGEKFGEGM